MEQQLLHGGRLACASGAKRYYKTIIPWNHTARIWNCVKLCQKRDLLITGMLAFVPFCGNYDVFTAFLSNISNSGVVSRF